MRRLYQKIYLTILAALLLVVLVAGAFWRFGTEPPAQILDVAGELVSAALPPADAPAAAQQTALNSLAGRLKADLALFDAARNPIAAAGRPLPPPREDGPGIDYGRIGPIASLQLPDRRWLVVHANIERRHPAIGLVFFIGIIAIAVGLSAYPVVRGLTRRLERLQRGVETLGAGNFGARVHVAGRDEVAQLAASFNRAAERIAELVNAHRMLLANASHELRTPLSRIRLGLELFEEDRDPKYRVALERDIAELDALIGEILLASRLDAIQTPDTLETVDLLALAAEEAARYSDCSVEGSVAHVRGDPRLLRRLIRNLLENAARHGKPPVTVQVRPENGRAVLDVIDAGAGIPTDERERVFTPFHRLGTQSTGAGLGLSLVRQIARLHGGDAIVATRDDAASCFRVTLPLAAA